MHCHDGVPFTPDCRRLQACAYRDVAYLGVATPEVTAALRAAECADFHQQLSHRDEGRPLEGGVGVGHWTWSGALTGKRGHFLYTIIACAGAYSGVMAACQCFWPEVLA